MNLTPLQKFGEWTPDKVAFESGGATVATNVVAVGEDYAPVKDLVSATSGLAAACRGAISVKASDGVPYTFAGTDAKLYLRNGTGWTDVTRTSGGDYTGTSDNRWVFCQYGDYVLATNGVDAPQYYLIGTSTDFAGVSGAPVCRFLSVINNFVVASGLTSDKSMIEWSALDNPLDWTASASTQSDSQQFYEVGGVSAVTGGQNSGVVIGTDGIGLMEYVGPPFIFTFRVVEPNRGSGNSYSIVSYAGGAFYYADAFYYFNGTSSTLVGYEKVDEWFKLNTSIDNINPMTTTVDRANKLIMFGVPSATAGVCNYILAYAWATQRWTLIEKSVQALFQSLTEAVNLDDLSSTNGDDVDVSGDSALYSGGAQFLGAFNTSNALCTFSGSNLTATIESTEFQPNPDGRSYIHSIALFGEFNTATIAIKHRALQTASASMTSTASIQSTGEAYFNTDNRYIRAVVSLTGDWRRVTGIKARFDPTGLV